MTTPSELREAISKAMILAKGVSIEEINPHAYKLHYLSDVDADIDAILDAVIASLPDPEKYTEPYTADYEVGRMFYAKEVRDLLQSAKSTSKESE